VESGGRLVKQVNVLMEMTSYPGGCKKKNISKPERVSKGKEEDT